MIHRLDGLHSLPDDRSRPARNDKPNNGDFEQTLKELEGQEERDPQATVDLPADSTDEHFPNETHTTQLQGEGSEQGLEVEAFLLPWQLLSQSTLSHVARLQVGGRWAGGIQNDDGIATPVATGAHAQAHVNELSLTTVYPGDATVSHAWNPGRAQDAVHKSGESGASHPSMSGLANPWAERLVRWISDPEQRLTAWVRDYGLEDADVSSLIRDLREHASEQSVQLARIVINGQERWNARNAHTTEPS